MSERDTSRVPPLYALKENITEGDWPQAPTIAELDSPGGSSNIFSLQIWSLRCKIQPKV